MFHKFNQINSHFLSVHIYCACSASNL